MDRIGQKLTGKEFNALNNEILLKVTNNEMKHFDFQYKIGENKDIHKLTTKNCSEGGLYFSSLKNIHLFSNFGNGYHIVTIPDDTILFIEESKAKAEKIIISEKTCFFNVNILFNVSNPITAKVQMDFHIGKKMELNEVQIYIDERRGVWEICKELISNIPSDKEEDFYALIDSCIDENLKFKLTDEFIDLLILCPRTLITALKYFSEEQIDKYLDKFLIYENFSNHLDILPLLFETVRNLSKCHEIILYQPEF